MESRFADLDRPVLLTGIQALVRVLLEQARLDRAAGLNTGGLVSGYRGSPLGGLDRELWRRNALLAPHNIRFQPGVNEDLAATMLYGTQQLDAFPGKRVDGVFGMWYGKGPGVDRAGDALHCGNFLGTAAHGGVLAVSGDDHGAHSSTYPHQTEHVFEGVFIPVLNPSAAQDILDLGLAGIALSRFSGLWVALKTTAETAEQAATLVVPSARAFITPDFPIPSHGLNFDPGMRFPADRMELERRVVQERLPAGTGLGARQPPRQAYLRRRRRTDRHRHRRARARGRHACAADAEPRGPPADRALQGGDDLAAGDRRPARIRPRQARPVGGGGEAQLRRGADPRRALQPSRSRTSGDRRQDHPRRCAAAVAVDGAVAGDRRCRACRVPAFGGAERC